MFGKLKSFENRQNFLALPNKDSYKTRFSL